MEKVLLMTCFFAVSSAIFFPWIQLPNQRQSMMNVCIYSQNPARYQPKCFLCPSTVYPNVLRTCVNAAAIPSNISYTQASCIEQNCMISRGRRSVDSSHVHNLLGNEPYVPEMPDDDGRYQLLGTEEFTASDGDYYYDGNADYADLDVLPDPDGSTSENQRGQDSKVDASRHT